MFGPVALTHFVYIMLPIAFVAVMTYVVIYNFRVKARQRELTPPGEHIHNTPSSIHAATEKLHHEHDMHYRH